MCDIIVAKRYVIMTLTSTPTLALVSSEPMLKTWRGEQNGRMQFAAGQLVRTITTQSGAQPLLKVNAQG
jgi:hypothetical protein